MNKISQRTLFLIGFLVSIGLNGITFYLQQYDGFIPCPLCVLQRIALGLLTIIFLLGILFAKKKIGYTITTCCAGITSILGMLLSGRQVWLQHLPADKNADCGVSLQYLINVLPYDQIISKILKGTAESSQKGWEFLHLSLAGWSLICFVSFFMLCLYQIKRSLN